MNFLPTSHPAVNGPAMAAYHAERAAYFKREQVAALKRGAAAAVCLGLGDAWRKHRTMWHACNLAVGKCLTD